MKAYLEIEMPTSCGSCLFRRLWPEDDEVECIIEKTLWTKDAEKNPACPLLPVPEHWRLSRLTPKKPKVSVDTWVCPECGRAVEFQEMIGDNILFHGQHNFCPNCGQSIDWEEQPEEAPS